MAWGLGKEFVGAHKISFTNDEEWASFPKLLPWGFADCMVNTDT